MSQEELMSCPFCGKWPTYDALVYCDNDDCAAYLIDFEHTGWQNAVCWSRLDEARTNAFEDENSLRETIRALEKKLKWITDLHAEVSGRNVTLYCRNAELERILKENSDGRGTKPEI